MTEKWFVDSVCTMIVVFRGADAVAQNHADPLRYTRYDFLSPD